MRVERAFTVPVPLERAWHWLTDVDAIASCLPSADLRHPDGERVYIGEMTLSANGSSVRCRTSVRPIDADEDARAARLRIEGRQVGGAGLAAGTLEGRLAPADGGTRVALSADVTLAGHHAQADALQAAGGALMDEFARGLEQRMHAEPPAVEAPTRPRAATAAPQPEPEPAGRDLAQRLARYGPLAGVAVLLAFLLAALRRPSKGLSLEIRYRW